jgi:hypothetical protein
MATFGQTFVKGNAKKAICLMNSPVDVAAPTLATDGVPNYHDENRAMGLTDNSACYTGRSAMTSTLMIHTSAGSGSLTGIFTLYGYLAAAAEWFPIKVNGGAAVAATGKIAYTERFLDLGHYDRLALGLASSGGTTPTFEAFVVTGLAGTGDY